MCSSEEILVHQEAFCLLASRLRQTTRWEIVERGSFSPFGCQQMQYDDGREPRPGSRPAARSWPVQMESYRLVRCSFIICFFSILLSTGWLSMGQVSNAAPLCHARQRHGLAHPGGCQISVSWPKVPIASRPPDFRDGRGRLGQRKEESVKKQKKRQRLGHPWDKSRAQLHRAWDIC